MTAPTRLPGKVKKSFKCTKCGIQVARRGKLKKHYRRKHPEATEAR